MENLYSEKSDNYYSLPRLDILSLINDKHKKILEIGCAFGELGKSIKRNFPEVIIDGIELNPHSRDFLLDIYNNVSIGNIEFLDFSKIDNEYDLIIIADVLEHLYDPWRILNLLHEKLSDNGNVIVSVPNLRNSGILFNLIVRGRFEYAESGLMDRTHIRWFTRHEIIQALDDAGLQVLLINVNYNYYSSLKKFLIYPFKFLIKDFDVCQFIILANRKVKV
jgi:2-polyprenyl-3-methyl-5-hydroxy-6-metoxy-1,4-benzoquinol methylase